MNYKAKPYKIEAVKLDLGNLDALVKFAGRKVLRLEHATNGLLACSIETADGTLTATTGDYLVRDTHGSYSACKPETFAERYEDDTDNG